MKYTLTENTQTLFNGTVLHQIRAEEDFGDAINAMMKIFVEKMEAAHNEKS